MSDTQQNKITNKHLIEIVSITNIGVWIWNLQTDHVSYSKEWARIVGYDPSELVSHVSTWESMLLPSDLAHAESRVALHLAGQAPIYEAEFRMVKKDGSIIWGHDKGRITQYTEDGKPLILCGVLQDITSIKLTEQKLRESTEILNLAIEVAEFGTWDWDLEANSISYNDEYLKMLGYTQDEITGTLEEWEDMNHPEDLPMVSQMLDDFTLGRILKYECETRMRHKNGHYIWTRDVGRIAAKDDNGKAKRVIGGHLNIDGLKQSKSQLEATLRALENHQTHLEQQIEERTKALLEQDHLLLTVNEISRKLLTLNDKLDFDHVLTDCLKSLALAYGAPEITLWRFIIVQGRKYIYISHAYKDGHELIFNLADIPQFIESLPPKQNILYQKPDGNIIIHYGILKRDFRRRVETERATADFMTSIPDDFADYLKGSFSNNHSLLVSPIYIYNDLFGFIAVGSENDGHFHTEAQDNMLMVSGKLFANAQKKHETDEQLRQAHEEALLSSKAKSNFLANMSHEIRTPLNAILGMAEIVSRESAGRATESYSLEIKKASENLLAIINDILDISKIESGKLEIINSEYYISSLFNDVISLLRIRLEDKPILFTTFIDRNIPAKLKGDEVRLKQILLNLLGNAIKFTKSGNIHLSATCKCENNVAILRFEVSDTGSGIKEDDMDKLFLQFERVDTKKNRNIEGTGLGLAITKQLCEMMGGNISVHSIYGEGSTFTICLPQTYTEYLPLTGLPPVRNVLLYEARKYYANSILQTVENLGSQCTVCTNQSELFCCLNDNKYDYLLTSAVHLSKVKSVKQSLQQDFDIVLMTEQGDLTMYRDVLSVSLPLYCLPLSDIFGGSGVLEQNTTKANHFIAPDAKVLVVDDNQVNLMVAKGLMSLYKLNIETAANGALAVDMVKNKRYDLVFMDHMMPEMDGIDATAEIRKLPGDYFCNLPIVALTANALVGARELFEKEGMNDFLAKPIETQKLNDILLRWIPKEKQQSAAPMPWATGSEYEIYIEGINTQYGLQLVGGKVSDYMDVLATFYKDGLRKTSSLYTMYVQRDLVNFKIDIHALKSAMASIGAFHVSQQAKKLEEAAQKDDWDYIDAHFEDFLHSFENLLSTLEGHVQPLTVEDTQAKSQGDVAILETNLSALEEALNSFDIDLIEKTLHDCMAYEWAGSITKHLQMIQEFSEAFEYYNARPLLDSIKTEISQHYS